MEVPFWAPNLKKVTLQKDSQSPSDASLSQTLDERMDSGLKPERPVSEVESRASESFFFIKPSSSLVIFSVHSSQFIPA